MKLSTKLKISFCVLIVLPVFLFSAAFMGVTAFQMRELRTLYNIEDGSYDMLINSTKLLSNMCRSEYERLVEAADKMPDMLSNSGFLDTFNRELSKKSAFLIVVEDGLCTYSGSEISSEILSRLTQIDYGENDNAGIYLGGDYQMLIKTVSYTRSGGIEGTAYIVMQIQKIVPQLKSFVTDIAIAVILILVLVSALFNMWIYRQTVSPIKRLKLATYNIKNGNLDFDIEVKGHDEIAELCSDFDDMRRRLKENAEETVRLDAENKILISNISHDLKTPITAIKGYVEGIMDGVVDSDEKMERYIRTIYNKACDMDKLINELTFYSKIDTDRVPYNFARINVTDYFDDCTEELGVELESEGITLIYENNLAADTRIIADAEQLKRVINNIVGNSVKYMDKDDKRISLRLAEDEDYVKIDIEDNGRGISGKDIGRVFDRFYRGDASRSSAQGGSGIGLSIVRKIIDDHGGMISVESVRGEGTTMHISMLKYKETPPRPKRIKF
ncbi:MAG: HAMP domain-containing histidine kinase [Butyrivibrio sp.]|nr:HAMP domain-containing histidine kinase [Butyrivibrio sp.]